MTYEESRRLEELCSNHDAADPVFEGGTTSRPLSQDEIDALLGFDKHRDEDPLASPPHYTDGRRFEPWDVIIDWELPWTLGNAVAYLARCDRKGGPDKAIEDLRKAIKFIEREIRSRVGRSSEEEDHELEEAAAAMYEADNLQIPFDRRGLRWRDADRAMKEIYLYRASAARDAVDRFRRVRP